MGRIEWFGVVRGGAEQGEPVTSSAKTFKPEINGLRAVAALLVAVYHLWTDQISGGVDVFFVVSGYLITESLLRQQQAHGRLDLLAYATRLIRRLLPAAMLVLVFVVFGSWIWLPQVRWAETLPQVIASALYFQNWQLAIAGVDYLGKDAAAGPTQHYWALSMQGQFYLLWPLLLIAATALGSGLKLSTARLFPAAVVLVLAGSLGYSIVSTQANQAWAYFDTFARIWQFALGAILALALPHLNPGRALRLVAGWLGLIAILSCGLLVPADQFPGYMSLWPSLSAALIILAGSGHVRWGADRLLAAAPVQWLGGISYSLYLWHWPLMVFFLAGTGRDILRSSHALFLLALSILLAWLTTRLVENRFRFSAPGRSARWQGPALAVICLAPVLLLAGGWQLHVQQSVKAFQRLMLEDENYPGAVVLIGQRLGIDVPELEPMPSPLAARGDVPNVYEIGCHQMPRAPEVQSCAFGSEAPELTIAVVGGSHSAHWLPAFKRLAEQHPWRIVNVTKSACRLTAVFQHGHPSCHEWNLAVPEYLAEIEPDLVFTIGTLGEGEAEHVPPGYIKQWRTLKAMGIPVLALRDTPRLGFNVPECVARYGADAPNCGWDRQALRGLDNPLLDEAGLPASVEVLDLTDYLCLDDHCPPVIGNVLVYRDAHHITSTFARTMAPAFHEPVQRAVERAQLIPRP